MSIDFSREYAERNDDELLHLASARHSLTTEAVAALDAELRRRNLTESDRLEYQRLVKQQEQREAREHRRKPLGPFKYEMSWRDLLWAFATIVLISFAYFALPSRYHLKAGWEDAAFMVMMTSVLIVTASRSVFRRKSTLWVSLVVSSAIYLVLLHAWTQRVPIFRRYQGRGLAVLGLLLFLAVYGLVSLLRRSLYGKEAKDNS